MMPDDAETLFVLHRDITGATTQVPAGSALLVVISREDSRYWVADIVLHVPLT